MSNRRHRSRQDLFKLLVGREKRRGCPTAPQGSDTITYWTRDGVHGTARRRASYNRAKATVNTREAASADEALGRLQTRLERV